MPRSILNEKGTTPQMATTDQRRFLVNCFRRAGWDYMRICILHRNIKIDESWIGRDVSEWLDSLTRVAATVYSRRMREFLER